jgi:hypothetical protein
MTIPENEHKTGWASWFYSRKYNDYYKLFCENVNDFLRFNFKQCAIRLKDEKLQKGDLIKVTVIGGWKPRRYTGIVDDINENGSVLWLRQKKRIITIEAHSLDNIEILERFSDLTGSI